MLNYNPNSEEVMRLTNNFPIAYVDKILPSNVDSKIASNYN